MVYLHSPIREHALETTIVERELQVPAHRPKNDLHRELPTLERVLVLSLQYQSIAAPAIIAQSGQTSKLQPFAVTFDFDEEGRA